MSEPTNGDHVDPATNGVLSLALSEEDQRHLAQLEQKFQVIRDFTASVATYRTTGAYIFGQGGTSKSYQVVQELERL